MKLIITTIAAVLLVGCANLPRSTPVSTQLHFAVVKGNIEAAKQSIADGANVNKKEGLPKGTPLHKAAMFGHKEIVELLIAKGADVNAKRNDGKTPLDDAVVMGRKEISDLLRKHGG